MRALVLGIGNILLSDEGVGVRALEALRAACEPRPAVDFIDGGTSAMELLDDLEGLDLLIVLDAVRSGGEAGRLIRLAGDEVPVFFRTRLSPHQIGLAEVLATLSLLDQLPREVVVIGVEPLSLDTGLTLTPVVAARVPEMVRMVVDELAARGLGLSARPAPVASEGVGRDH